MFVYFCSDYPAVLKVNGTKHQKINNLPKKIDCSFNNCFIEICPLVSTEKPLCFYLDKEFLSAPSNRVCVVDLKGGYLINLVKSPAQEQLKVIAQEKTNSYSITCFCENGYKLSIETPFDFYFENLPFSVDSAKVLFFDNNIIGIELVGENTFVAVYNLANKITRLFFQLVNECEYSNLLITVKTYNDIAKHKVICKWNFNNQNAVLVEKIVNRCPNFHHALLCREVLPFAFLEELLVGGDCTPYLCENLKNSCDKLKGFLGEFIGVCPPPPFREQNQVGLVYKKDTNQYKLEYLLFDLDDNNKITNLKFAN